MKIAVTTDHAGYEAIKELIAYLESQNHECVYFGPKEFDAYDDYPDYIFPAAYAVAQGDCERAIIMGGSGQGEAMVANRVPGVRAAVFYGPEKAKTPVDAEGHKGTDPYEIVRLSRQHNDANVLSLSSRFLDTEQMKRALSLWLTEPFSGQERHVRRIKKLDQESGITQQGVMSREDLVSPRLQLAFLFAIALYYLFNIGVVIQNYLSSSTYVSTDTWTYYQLTVWLLPVLYLLLGLSFIWKQYHRLLERFFFGCLLGAVGFLTYSAVASVISVWITPSYASQSIWVAFGFNWALMLGGLTIFTGVIAILSRKKRH